MQNFSDTCERVPISWGLVVAMYSRSLLQIQIDFESAKSGLMALNNASETVPWKICSNLRVKTTRLVVFPI